MAPPPPPATPQQAPKSITDQKKCNYDAGGAFLCVNRAGAATEGFRTDTIIEGGDDRDGCYPLCKNGQKCVNHRCH